MAHYDTFEKLMEASVSPLRNEYPDWDRLDGQQKGGNRKVFATFSYQNEIWKIHADTRIDKLVAAWEIAKSGHLPFQIAKTKQDKTCLRLVEGNKEKADGLYIYLQE